MLATTLLCALLGLIAYFLRQARESQDRTEILMAELEDAREDQMRAAALDRAFKAWFPPEADMGPQFDAVYLRWLLISRAEIRHVTDQMLCPGYRSLRRSRK